MTLIGPCYSYRRTATWPVALSTPPAEAGQALRARLLTSAIALPLVILVVVLGGWPLVAAVTAVVIGACAEYFHSVGMARFGAIVGVSLAALQAFAAKGDSAEFLANWNADHKTEEVSRTS